MRIVKGDRPEIKSRSRLLADFSVRGLIEYPTHYRLREDFAERPAQVGVLDLVANPTTAAFDAYVIANKHWLVQGTNATTALVTFAEGGGVTLTTAGASADQMILTPHTKTDKTAWGVSGTWGTENSPRFEVWLRTGASIADVTIWAGLKLTNTPVIATNNDSAFFRYQDTVNGGRWQFNASATNVDDTKDSGIAVAASTLYRLSLEVNADRQVQCKINGRELWTSGAPLLTTAINLIPYIGIQADTAAAKAMDVLYAGGGRAA